VRPVELDPVLTGARDLIGSSLGPLIDITLALDTASAWTLTDPDQLELAILNLAVNARDAMPTGGTLRIESGPCRIRLGDEADEGSYLSIRVIDDGGGMPEEVAAQAIEPFFTTKERDKGTGLGLAQVYGFVRQCGGDLRIVSAVGAGTSVEILLRCAEPLLDGATPTTRKNEEAAARSGSGREVLVVDDDDAVRAVIVDALTAAGFLVHEASSGAAGLSLLDTISPVAAVIDFLMPGMNGAEVARFAQQRRPGLPIVFVSGYSDTVALDGIMGAVVLRKPFDIGALDRALSSVLH
jgi:CheY-like chemotaxis protein